MRTIWVVLILLSSVFYSYAEEDLKLDELIKEAQNTIKKDPKYDDKTKDEIMKMTSKDMELVKDLLKKYQGMTPEEQVKELEKQKKDLEKIQNMMKELEVE